MSSELDRDQCRKIYNLLERCPIMKRVFQPTVLAVVYREHVLEEMERVGVEEPERFLLSVETLHTAIKAGF